MSGRYPKRQSTGRPPGKPKRAPGATRKLEHEKPDEVISVPRETCPKGHKLGPPRAATRKLWHHPDCPTKGELGPTALTLIQDLRIRERASYDASATFEESIVERTKVNAIRILNKVRGILKL